ncbi:hypothetical protein XM57_22125 [Burkholderia cepacia]|nr:hypothetical protein XM57_22125 [Burkholderia cepacia]
MVCLHCGLGLLVRGFRFRDAGTVCRGTRFVQFLHYFLYMARVMGVVVREAISKRSQFRELRFHLGARQFF